MQIQPHESIVQLMEGQTPSTGQSENCPYAAGTLICFPATPDFRTGHSMIICPGGGYSMLAWEKEGVRIARWLSSQGISAFVCFYPVADGAHFPAPLDVARKAVCWVREHCEEWQGAPDKIGIMGFSAGGHLAGMTAFGFAGNESIGLSDNWQSRPDFSALIYPVSTFCNPATHTGSRDNLLGKNCAPELSNALSHENMVSSKAGPVYLFHTNEDVPVPAENSLMLALALRKAGVPVELHLHEKGGHGIGLLQNHPWGSSLVEWIHSR